jgi:hypothetical protein
MTAGVIAALIPVPVRVTDGMTAIFPQIIVATLVIMADRVVAQEVDQAADQVLDPGAARAVPRQIPEDRQYRPEDRQKMG